MTFTDIARRTYDHNFRLDPIVRSLLDTDFYKLLMLQMIRHVHPDVATTFSLINRTTSVRLADVIDEAELRAQLDHARTVRFTKKELIWLAGNSFYGRQQMFGPISSPGSRISACPNTSCTAATGNTNCISPAPGPTPRCGKFPRWRSSTNCARAPRCATRASSRST
jgi:hypothetical protein